MNKFQIYLVCFIFVFSCSYSPILVNENYNFKFIKITFNGNNEVNEIINSNLKQKGSGEVEFEIIFYSERNREILTSDAKGDPNTYQLNIKVDYIVSTDKIELIKDRILKKSTYTNIRKITDEVENAKKTFKKYKWPIIDVTRKSVEETAASIIKIHEIKRKNA